MSWFRLRRVFLHRLPPSASLLVRQVARREWKLLTVQVLSFLALVVAETVSVATIFFAVRALVANRIEPIAGLPPFLAMLILAAGLQLLVAICRYIYGFVASTFAARCEIYVASVVHRYVLSLSYPCASQYRIGDLSRLASLAPTALQYDLQLRSELISNALLISTYVLILIVISYKLSFFLVLLILAMSMLLRVVRPRVRASYRQLAALHSSIAADITEDIRALRLLHSTAALPVAQQRLDQRLLQVAAGMRRLTRVKPLLEPVMDVLPVLMGLLVGGVSWWFLGGNSEVLFPNLVVIVLVIQRANMPINRSTTQLANLDANSGSIRELETLLNPADKQFRRQGGLPFRGLVTSIRFEAVGFRYPGRDVDALHDISFELPLGGSLAVVGESGSGKSTLADLITGLYEPTRGRILVDGQDLAQVDLDDWQRQLGIVSQDVIMLNGTIRQNICFGLPPVTDQRLQAACEAAGAAGFIRDLPDGVDHDIGESGHRLSGGQRQRLSLARAFLRNPSLLVLDEATSALDSRSELHVLQALARASTNRTVLTIAHRLSSVRDADQILVMDGGRIVERGRHAELLALAGIYAELWHKQTSSPPVPETVDA
jgi:subfamily B ATP-binding cassette protein MsbA